MKRLLLCISLISASLAQGQIAGPDALTLYQFYFPDIADDYGTFKIDLFFGSRMTFLQTNIVRDAQNKITSAHEFRPLSPGDTVRFTGTTTGSVHTINAEDNQNTGTYEPTARYVISMDASGMDTSLIMQTYSTSQSAYVNSRRNVFSYNSNQTIDQYHQYDWNSNNSTWELLQTNQFHYSGTQLDSIIVTPADPMDESHKYHYIYSGGSLDSTIEYSNEYGSFLPMHYFKPIYNNGVIEDLEQYSYDSTSSQYSSDLILVFQGGSGGSGLVDNKATELHIYPNPVADNISLSGFRGNYKIAGMDGKVYESGKFEEYIHTADLNAGAYVLMIKHKGEYYSGSFIKK